MLKKLFSHCFVVIFIYSTNTAASDFVALKTDEKITVDGLNNEKSWQLATWYPIDKLMVGSMPKAADFSGRFKLLWDKQYLYLQAEIIDDIIFDQHSDPLHFYWDDDCLEIFIDEDKSGGDHLNNFNAFAYHIGIDNQSVDIGTVSPNGETQFVLLNDHITSHWRRSSAKPNTIVWEVAMSIYNDTFVFPNENNAIKPIRLHAKKEMGFMLAYCDNDGSEFRESFMGSTDIKPVNGDKNLGYKTADVFGSVILKP